MKLILRVTNVFFILLLTTNSVFASNLEENLKKYFKKYGIALNTSRGELFSGQKSGYATGGSIAIRNNIKQTKPVGISLPKIDSGCGGIDIFAGGVSFIDSEQLCETLKAICSNSAGYAFNLALEAISPQVSNCVKTMQSWSNTMNTFNINSCETASKIVDASWDQAQKLKEHLTQSQLVNGHEKGSFLGARSLSSNPIEQARVFESLHESNPETLINTFNIAWIALKNQSVVPIEKDNMERLMTFFGTKTCSVSDEDKVLDAREFSAKILSENYYNTLLDGEKIPIYRCQDEECLNIQEEKIVKTAEETLIGKIQMQLLSIQEKIVKDDEGAPFTVDEMELIENIPFPIFWSLNILAAYRKGISHIELSEIANIVANQKLLLEIKEGIHAIHAGCKNIYAAQFTSKEIKEYLSDLYRVERNLYSFEQVINLPQKEYNLIERLKVYERDITDKIKLF